VQLLNKLIYCREVLLDSKFYADLLGRFFFKKRLDNHCLDSKSFQKVTLNDKLVPTTPHDIVCYGIGSIQESKNAQFQFVLALILRDLLKVS
jgi:hypothetical protein